MASRYRATVEVEYWKQHLCVGCGSAYRYRLKRKKSVSAASQYAANEAANRAAIQAAKQDVDLCPCPHCGLYQPDMIGSRRSRWHLVFALVSIALLLLMLILGVSDAVSGDVTTWISVVIGVIVLGGHLVVVLWNPNRNLKANRATARKLFRSASLELVETCDDEQPAPSSGPGLGHLAVLALMALAMMAMATGELVRIAKGWPLNSGWAPGVIGPGDTAKVWFPERIESLKSLWNGQATAEIVNANELKAGDLQLVATSSNATWGQMIFVKDSEKHSLSTPWAKVSFPDDPRLAGKTVQLRIQLHATFPVWRFQGFEEAEQNLSQNVSLKMADTPNAGAIYSDLRNGGAVAGLILIGSLGMGLYMMGRMLRGRAHPTKVKRYRPDRDEDEEDEDREDDEDDRPRGRRRRDDEDEEDEDREDDEDDRPRRRRRHDDDD